MQILLYMVKDTVGLIHLIASIISLIVGTIVLASVKGTQKHKGYGYVYCVAMVVTLTTSFLIYRLYNRFGVFHYLALVSGITLVRGMLPMLIHRTNNSLKQHFRSMYWSVVGLYAAFAAELLVRVPFLYKLFSSTILRNIFHYLVVAATIVVIALSLIVFLKKKPKWLKLADKFKRYEYKDF